MDDAPEFAINFVTSEELRDELNPFVKEWRARTIADAIRPRPPRIQYVDRILREGSLNIVFGPPGSLKSLLLMDMMVCIASGRPWLESMPGTRQEQSPFSTTQAPCMWIDYDNGEDLTDERFEAFSKTYDLPVDCPISYYTLALPWLDLSKADNAFHLMNLIARKGAKVVVIDNLGLVKGAANENTDEMQPVMSHLRQIADTTRAAIVLIHHQRKSGTNGDSGTIRKGETVRGYSGIEAACDLILHVDRRQNEDTITLTPTKVRRMIPFTTAGALWTYQNDNGDVLQTARFFAWATDDAKTILLKSIKATVLDMLMTYPGVNQSKLVEHVADWFAAAGQKKPGRDTIRGVIKQMVEDGEIAERKGERTNNREELRYYKAA